MDYQQLIKFSTIDIMFWDTPIILDKQNGLSVRLISD